MIINALLIALCVAFTALLIALTAGGTYDKSTAPGVIIALTLTVIAILIGLMVGTGWAP